VPSWTVLDTNFQNGQAFLQIWLQWRQDPRRPRMLHYVGIAPVSPQLTNVALAEQAPKAHSPLELPHLQQLLAQACLDRGPGFHRITFNQGQVSLTLCIGPVHTILSEQVCMANTLLAGIPENPWAAQLLARRSQRGARLYMSAVHSDAQPVLALLQAAGFQMDANHPSPSGGLSGTFNPRWTIATSRNPNRAGTAVARCAVVGAGLAGASIAHALSLRGWQVSVFDQQDQPAAGASGVPAGLAVPQVSLDDSPGSRLSRSGIRLMMQQAQQLLQEGQDWAPSGVMQVNPDGGTQWHTHAAWVKPTRLVQAWLEQPGITFTGLAQIAALVRQGNGWQLHDPHGQSLGTFEVVILANALGSAPLLESLDSSNPQESDGPMGWVAPRLIDKLAALQAVHGTLSHGNYAQPIPGLPAHPVNGKGAFIPHVSGPVHGLEAEQWFAGSTFEPHTLTATDRWAQHSVNMERLQTLLPGLGKDLPEKLGRSPVSLWSGTRCVTHDRMPLVGPVDSAGRSGLWLCVGLGSRGLSFSALCAQLLVGRLCAEPLAVEASLAKCLDSQRVRRKRAKTQ
jgi:tRNA 5-methylaminomethyl-2-thiouridine biosynthesis bifunctional protein